MKGKGRQVLTGMTDAGGCKYKNGQMCAFFVFFAAAAATAAAIKSCIQQVAGNILSNNMSDAAVSDVQKKKRVNKHKVWRSTAVPELERRKGDEPLHYY